ncbi:MAG TPA: gliding motility-associated C-terminal domain-containing protein [Puia sp.]|nr:gliding motility-associated C-terminal domain-containing protein [Puia sp.]
MCKGPAVLVCLLFAVLTFVSGRVCAQLACPTISSLDIVNADCGGNGASITIHATGGSGTLLYSIDGINYKTSNIFMGSEVQIGPFFAYVKDAICSSSMQGEVLKKCLKLHVESTNPGCNNDDGTITAVASDGVEPYQYSIDLGATWQTSGVFTGLSAKNYQVIVMDASTPSQSTSSPVTLTQVCIQATVTPHDATCGQNNGTLDISASGGAAPYTYVVNGTSYTDAHITGLPPGAKTIVVNDVNGPGPTLNTTINAAPLPTLTATPTGASCLNNDGTVVIVGTTGPAPYQYALDAGDYSGNGTIGQVSSGNHEAHVKDGNGCIVSQTVTVPLNNSLTVNGGPPVPVCQGTSKVIQATSNGTTFSWQPAAGLDNPHILQPTASPTVNTTYILTASLGACQKTASVDVTINPAPVAAASPSPGKNICTGESIQLQAIGGPNYTYSWVPTGHLDNPASANPTVSGLTEATTFHLTVWDGNRCKSQNTADVIISLTPPPRVSAGNDTSILLGQALPLHAIDVDNVGLGGWVWNPSEGLDNDGIADPIAHPEQSITYTVTGYTYNYCPGSAKITVNVYTTYGIFVPNAFTPNGDGHNDVLRPVLVGIKELKYFAVFDRWGQRVFYTTNATEGWRGRNNGQDQPMGTYVWMVGGVDLKGTAVQQKGTVLLIR